jgi:antitoxin (DNA-binding transcriptional repressor) of toxin-antitoxin stability system
VMRSVSIQALKAGFAAWAGMAAGGETVQITKHNRPYLLLTGCRNAAVHQGSRAGGELGSALKGPTHGKWRQVLDEDRRETR